LELEDLLTFIAVADAGAFRRRRGGSSASPKSSSSRRIFRWKRALGGAKPFPLGRRTTAGGRLTSPV